MRRTITGRHSLTGRGVLSNPPGRFDRQQLEAVDDGWYQDEVPDSIPETLEPDKARGVISTNDSPDIPFEQSINPYRGCSHACSYCLWGDTPILLLDGRTCPIAELRVGDEIFGSRRIGRAQRYVKSRVLAKWSVIKPAFRTSLEDGTTLVTSGDHRFLTDRGWKFVTNRNSGPDHAHLRRADRLLGTGAFAHALAENDDYRRGYLCATVRRDAYPGAREAQREHRRPVIAHRFSLCEREALVRVRNYLLDFEVATYGSVSQAATGGGRALDAIGTGSVLDLGSIERLIAFSPSPTREWSAGFLAGIFDAAGHRGEHVLSFCHTDRRIIDWIRRSLRVFRFTFVGEHDCVRLTGGLRERLRFFHTVSPAVSRRLGLEGCALGSDARLRVVSVEPVETLRLYDITTETGDFISDGVLSHNCYARPSHAYMGLSPGLDFETRLFYKADAAKVLEAQLSRPGYVCKSITLGANTDPYQPVERRMGVTRSILEVLARTHHPVCVITKSALVLRDLDLLTEMARQGLASVAVSVTTLNADLKRVMEPRAASPQARLRTLAALSAAGVPTVVMVAPVIPAMNDHELEDILAEAAQAGARWAGYVLLRLPYELKALFTEWLTEHYPQRAGHVMSLIRAMREGRENDPRFGARMRGTGPYALLLGNRFRLACRRLNLNATARDPLTTALFTPPAPAAAQLRLGL